MRLAISTSFRALLLHESFVVSIGAEVLTGGAIRNSSGWIDFINTGCRSSSTETTCLGTLLLHERLVESIVAKILTARAIRNSSGWIDLVDTGYRWVNSRGDSRGDGSGID